MNNIKIILVLVTSVVLLIFFYIILYRGSISIKINDQFIVNIDNTEHKAKDFFKKRLKPGNYKLIISKNGYKNFEKELKISFLKNINIEDELIPVLTKIESNTKNTYFNGKFAYYFDNSNSIVKHDLEKNETKILPSNITLSPKSAIWSPDSKKIVFFTDEKRPQTFLIDLEKNISKKIEGYNLTGDWSENNEKFILVNYYSSTVSIYDSNNLQKNNLEKDTINPLFIRWFEKYGFLMYSAIEVGDALPIFEIFNLSENKSYYMSNDYVENAEFIKDKKLVFYVATDINDNKIKSIYKLGLDEFKKEVFFDGNFEKFKIINNKIYILDKKGLLVLNSDGATEKKYSFELGTDSIKNFYVYNDKLFLEIVEKGNSNLYYLILR